MTTRQSIVRKPEDELSLPTGYDQGADVPTGFHMPSCGIEDVDVALFKLFEEELGYTPQEISGKQETLQLHKPFVVFAAGERFAGVKKLRPVRDSNGAIILPAISIRRNSIVQSDQDIVGRGINQMTGEITVKQRLDSSDRNYQLFANKLGLKNSSPVVVSGSKETVNNSVALQQGMLLDPVVLGNNIYEIITVPSPQFYIAEYDVVFWTSHQKHMNYMIETMFANYLPQRRGFQIDTDKGYSFLADIDDTYSNEGNQEEWTDDKRIIKYGFGVKVQGYMFALTTPGNAVPYRKHFSAPVVSFQIQQGMDVHKKQTIDDLENKSRFVLSDVLSEEESSQQPTTEEKFVVGKQVWNPVTKTMEIKYVQLSDQNKRTGETVYTAPDDITMSSFMFSNKMTWTQ